MTDLIPFANLSDILPLVVDTARDNFEQFLEHDPELAMAYDACLAAAGLLWTDEELAEAAFRYQYGADCPIDHLMQAWHWQRTLSNPNDLAHAHAQAVHEAVQRWQLQHTNKE